jgi:hypothetical protein
MDQETRAERLLFLEEFSEERELFLDDDDYVEFLETGAIAGSGSRNVKDAIKSFYDRHNEGACHPTCFLPVSAPQVKLSATAGTGVKSGTKLSTVSETTSLEDSTNEPLALLVTTAQPQLSRAARKKARQASGESGSAQNAETTEESLLRLSLEMRSLQSTLSSLSAKLMKSGTTQTRPQDKNSKPTRNTSTVQELPSSKKKLSKKQ